MRNRLKLTRGYRAQCEVCGIGSRGSSSETHLKDTERNLLASGWAVVNGEVRCPECAGPRLPKNTNRRICGLRTVRKAKGLTLQACADLMDSHIRTISGWEQGRHAPADATWIAARLGVPVEELYADPA